MADHLGNNNFEQIIAWILEHNPDQLQKNTECNVAM